MAITLYFHYMKNSQKEKRTGYVHREGVLSPDFHPRIKGEFNRVASNVNSRHLVFVHYIIISIYEKFTIVRPIYAPQFISASPLHHHPSSL